jgi:hypothetical protein
MRKQHKRITWKGKKPQREILWQAFRKCGVIKTTIGFSSKETHQSSSFLLYPANSNDIISNKGSIFALKIYLMNVYTNINTKSLDQFMCLFLKRP